MTSRMLSRVEVVTSRMLSRVEVVTSRMLKRVRCSIRFVGCLNQSHKIGSAISRLLKQAGCGFPHITVT